MVGDAAETNRSPDNPRRGDRRAIAAIESGVAFGTSVLTPQQVRQVSPTALAYIGDAVYELYVRQRFLFPPRRTHQYHQQVVAQVRAERQAQHLQAIEPYLNADERDTIRRGRNATLKPPKRLDPRTYQAATGLEALVGYLYLTDSQRLFDLLARLDFDDPSGA